MNKVQKSFIARICFVFVISLCISMIIFTVNYVAYSFDYQITTVLCGSNAQVDQEALSEANKRGKDVAMRIGEEGFTLLRNENGALPLGEDERKVSVFGRISSDRNFWYMGIGSGAGPTAGRISLYDGLEEAGLEVNPTLKAKYNSLPKRTTDYSDANTGLNHYTANELFEPSTEWLKAGGMLADAQVNYPTAIVVFGRGGSEDGDYDKYQTFTDENGNEVTEATARKDATRKYNQISEQEETLLNLVRQLFDKVIVVINSPNVMELGFLEKYNVDACIDMYYPGNYGTVALGNLLTGKANPSGKTPDIFAYDISTAPAYATAGRRDAINDAGICYVDYSEGIYVGYKWYETAYAENFWNSAYAQNRWGYYADNASDRGYKRVVQYPFGFGLSYTNFDWSVTDVEFSEGSSSSSLARDAKITFTVYVENSGDVPGQDVVELYCTPPYTRNGIEKSAVQLMAFAKTGILTPTKDGGLGEFVKLTVSLYDLASYDCYDLNGNNFMGYEVESGSYVFSLRTDSHTVKKLRQGVDGVYTYRVVDGYKYDTDPVTGNPVVNRFTTYTADSGASSNRQEHEPAIGEKIAYSIDGGEYGTDYMTRASFSQTFPVRDVRSMTTVAQNSAGVAPAAQYPTAVTPTIGDTSVTYTVADIIKIKLDEDGDPMPNLSKPILDDEGKQTYDAAGNPLYQPQYYIDEDVLDRVIEKLGADTLFKMIAAGSGDNGAPEIGLPSRVYKDGPSGISSAFVGIEGDRATNFPCEVAVAATWNWFLAYQLGLSVGNECAATNTAGWYGPACNLHRDPLGGRNYEYYSEDPYLSGIMVAYTVRGAKEMGVICWIKHIAANDDEIGRVGKYTWMSEQTFREVYLRPFQMSVQLGGANAMMAAFNRVGSVRARAAAMRS